MNRTHLFVASAALLALGAVGVGPVHVPPPPPPPSVRVPPSPPVERTFAQTRSLEGRSATASEGPLTLKGQLPLPWIITGPRETQVTFTVSAQPSDSAPRPPVNLALVMDRSGTMGGQKLRDVQAAARGLVRSLGPEDRLTLVHYGTDVVVLPGQRVTPRAREQLLAFVDALEDEGGTNLSGGLEAGIQELRSAVRDFRASRVILLSDGEPTEGLTGEEALWRLADKARSQGITVSALGLGEEFNARLMRGLAEHGGGFYGELRDSGRLADLLQNELQRAAGPLARSVQLRLELPEDVSWAGVRDRDSRREGSTLTVPLEDLFAGQQTQLSVRLVHDMKESNGERPVVTAHLDFQDARAERPGTLTVRPMARVTPPAPSIILTKEQLAARRAEEARRAQEAQKTPWSPSLLFRDRNENPR